MSRVVFVFALSLLLVLELTMNAFATENPEMSIDVKHQGNLWLFNIATGLIADTKKLNSSTEITWLSEGFNSVLELNAVGLGGVSFDNPSKMLVGIDAFSLIFPNGTIRPSDYTPNKYGQLYVSPVFSHIGTMYLIKYRLNFTTFTEKLSEVYSSTSVKSRKLLLSGHANLNFLTLGVIQEQGDTKFIRVTFLCDCSGTSAWLGVSTVDPNARQMIAQIGNTNLEMLAPNSFRKQYTIGRNQLTSLYAEWEVVPFYKAYPYNLLISSLVSLFVGALVTSIYHRIKVNRTGKQKSSKSLGTK